MRPASAQIAAVVLLAFAGLAVVAGWLPGAQVLLAAAVLAAVVLVDLLALRQFPTPSVVREAPAILPLSVEREVRLSLRPQGLGIHVEVHDGHPVPFLVEDLPQRLDLRRNHTSTVSYSVRANERGTYRFSAVDLRLASPLRLWTQIRRVPAEATVRVYPNFAPLTRLAMISAEQASRVIGAHLRRRRGDGTEFHQLREYRDGDSLRQIDWKASQRARKMISRDYREERNQQLMLLLDTGRRMLARDADLAHFDHVLNACLLLSWVALRQGDAVGLLAHGGEARFLKPQRGTAMLDRMLESVYDLHPQPVATDYLAAATELGIRQPRRSLVILITNARDEDIEDLLAAVRQLRRRHVVIVASLREQALDAARAGDIRHLDDALLVSATALYLDERRRTHEALRAHGASVLDVSCEQLPAALVERYLAIKREGVL